MIDVAHSLALVFLIVIAINTSGILSEVFRLVSLYCAIFSTTLFVYHSYQSFPIEVDYTHFCLFQMIMCFVLCVYSSKMRRSRLISYFVIAQCVAAINNLIMMFVYIHADETRYIIYSIGYNIVNYFLLLLDYLLLLGICLTDGRRTNNQYS